MAQRQKRSISLPADLAEAIDRAASSAGTTGSGWLGDTVADRLRLDAGRRAIAEWEADNGPLTVEELAEGLARARAVLGHTPAGQQPKQSTRVDRGVSAREVHALTGRWSSTRP